MKDYFEHIDDFIEGKLSSEEQILFETEIEKNPSLKTALDNYHDGKKISEGLLELDIMETISKIEETEKPKPEPKVDASSPLKWLKILGLLAIIFLIGIKIGRSLKSDGKKQELLASYIKPIDTEATKSIDTIDMNAFQKGKYFFALNKFQESEEWLKMYLSKEKNKKALSMGYNWLGAAHLEQGEVSEAKEAWEKSDEKSAKENLNLLSD